MSVEAQTPGVRSTPTVSVIVPNYNHAEFLPERIQSILGQTLQDFEIILLDDCSTDNSVAVLREYAAHPKVTNFVTNPANSGIPCRQWQEGLKLCRGQFVWIAESDDVAHPEFLLTMVSLLQESQHNVIAYCRSETIDSASRTDSQRFFWADAVEPERWLSDYVNNGADEIHHYLSKRNTIPNASAVVFRRSAADEHKVPTDMRYVGDWMFWIRLLRAGNIAFCSKVLSHFRMHPGTTRAVTDSTQEQQRFTEYLLGLEEAEASFRASMTPSGKDHSWILTEYWERSHRLPLWILRRNSLPLRLRLQFLWYAAVRRTADKAVKFAR